MNKNIVKYVCILLIITNLFAGINWDERLYRTIREDWQRDWLDTPMEMATIGGSKSFVMGINLAFYTWGGEEYRLHAKVGTYSLLLSSAITFSLKIAVNRERPEEDSPRWDSSFPSGHTTAAFATAVSYGLMERDYLIPSLGAATIVGFSRVYLGKHYPLDVLTGAVIGAASGYLVYKLSEKL